MPRFQQLTIVSLLLMAFSVPALQVAAQEGVSIDVKKPTQFENKILKSEKTGEKKFTLPRRLMQNTATHYNYYFNAKNKLVEIIDRAKQSHRDDFTELISFYPYSLDETVNETVELDSVILKSTAGILLHDLRNDWVDNLYLFIGQAYFLRKDFDSANMTFQYINYNFHQSRKETDKVYIGSNTNGMETVNVATKEKGGVLRKTFTLPPSRNDALLWQARNFIEMGDMIEASALLTILKTDKNFPSRLIPFHEELQAYWFYKQEQWDSAAIHFEKALDNATDRQDLARREYLLAQLYAKINNAQKASRYFNKASSHTTNLLMAIHADLNEAQLVKGSGENNIQSTVNELLKMARRDKYDAYRDLLYFSAAKLQMQLKDTAGAVNSYEKAISKAKDGGFEFKNKSFIALSEIYFNQKQYRKAASCLDSLQLADESIADKLETLEKRKFVLHQVATKAAIIEREDSLQRLAKMPEAEREAAIKKLLKKLRKEKGLKEEEVPFVNPAAANANTAAQQAANNFFTNTVANPNEGNGEWYFYNTTAKAKGFTEFKNKWGKRPNADNWRRASETVKSSFAGNTDTEKKDGGSETKEDGSNTAEPTELSYEAMLANVPLTPEQLKTSNDTIASSLFDLGGLYKNALEDYPTAAGTFENLNGRFTNYKNEEETLFNLYFCYLKTGDKQKADYYKRLLEQKFGSGKFASYVNNYTSGKVAGKDEVTKKYEEVYDLMLAGKFEKAFEEKQKADEKYGENHWSPQLLYIEAIYHIKQNNDSLAVASLDKILNLYPTSPLFPKAETLKDVLNRRAEIEDYLKNLQVTRMEEERVEVPYESNALAVNNDAKTAEQKQKEKAPQDFTVKDNQQAAGKLEAPKVLPQSEEERKAEAKEKQKIPTDFSVKNNNQQANKLDAPKVLPQGAEEKTAEQKEKKKTDLTVKANAGGPSVLEAKKDTSMASKLALLKRYTFQPETPHYVMMVLTNVDPIYVAESRNAFKRYNGTYHNNESIEVTGYKLDDSTSFNLFIQFPDALKAADYAVELKDRTQQIIPWLKGGKYYFLIISPQNLELLKERKDPDEYYRFLDLNMPNKF